MSIIICHLVVKIPDYRAGSCAGEIAVLHGQNSIYGDVGDADWVAVG